MGDRTIRRRTIRCGQFLTNNHSSQDISSRTIRRGQLVAKCDINVIEDLNVS